MTRIRRLSWYAGMILIALVLLFPVLYALSGSLMSMARLATFPAPLLPDSLHPENYRKVFSLIPLARQYANSVGSVSVVVLCQVICAVLSAYVFAFLHIPFKRALFALFIATMMIPTEAIIIPNYLMLADWGLLNTYWALVLPFLAYGFGTFLLRQSFLQFPTELRDAALLDGCGHLRFIARILVPLSRPALGALAIYVFIITFNQYLWPLLVTNTSQMQTIQIGVARLNSADSNQQNVVLAGVVLAVLPTLVLLYLFQRSIVRGLTAGALK